MVYFNPEDSLMRVPSAVAPVLLASLAHSLLQGIIFCQIVAFWRKRRADSLPLKIYVFTIFTLCLAQTICQIYKVWIVTISEKNWTEIPARYIEFPLNSVICSAVQAFFVRRVWKVTGKRWIVLIPLAVLMVATLVAGLTMAITINRSVRNAEGNSMECRSIPCLPEFSAWLWGSTALDATITITLSMYFLTLITAALPMASMLAAVSLFYATGGSHYHTVTALIVIAGKLYFNGLLRHLNVRANLKTSLEANVQGRRSIVTVGSANVRRKDVVTELTTIDEILDDIEKGAVGANYHQDIPQIYHVDAGFERAGFPIPESDNERGKVTRPSWHVRQSGSLYHSITL